MSEPSAASRKAFDLWHDDYGPKVRMLQAELGPVAACELGFHAGWAAAMENMKPKKFISCLDLIPRADYERVASSISSPQVSCQPKEKVE